MTGLFRPLDILCGIVVRPSSGVQRLEGVWSSSALVCISQLWQRACCHWVQPAVSAAFTCYGVIHIPIMCVQLKATFRAALKKGKEGSSLYGSYGLMHSQPRSGDCYSRNRRSTRLRPDIGQISTEREFGACIRTKKVMRCMLLTTATVALPHRSFDECIVQEG